MRGGRSSVESESEKMTKFSMSSTGESHVCFLMLRHSRRTPDTNMDKLLRDSNIAEHNRIDHNMHKALHRFLEGIRLAPLFERFQKWLVQRLDVLPPGGRGGVDRDGRLG